jgi:hypothetical protein
MDGVTVVDRVSAQRRSWRRLTSWGLPLPSQCGRVPRPSPTGVDHESR